MAKMTKAQARRRLSEVKNKLMMVTINYPEALSFTTSDSLLKKINTAMKKLK